MKEYIVRCENNKFTLEGEIVRCKDCGHRIVTDWYKYDKGMTRSVYNCDKNIINDNKDSDSCSYGKRKAVTEETDTDQNEVVDFNNMISAGGRIRNLLNGVAQIKVNTDEIVKRAKEKYEITDCPVCEDAISKHDLWRIIEDNAYWITYNETSKEKGMTLTGINQALNECPPVEPKPVCEDSIDRYAVLAELDPQSYEYKVVKELPSVIPQVPSEDAISRAETIKAMCRECTQEGRDECRADCTEVAVVKGMPPVEPATSGYVPAEHAEGGKK